MGTFAREEEVRRVARRQRGRLARWQLSALRVPNATVAHWIERGYLTRVLPRVYAVGHDAPDPGADRWAAVLYAGPGAMLSHATAAHHMGLIDHPPHGIHVSTPRVNVRSVAGRVLVHRGRDLVRSSWAGVPTTTVPQTLLDLAWMATAAAATGSSEVKLLRRALGVLDYRGELDVDAIAAICETGRRGSAALRDALSAYRPAFAHANAGLEERFLELCLEWKLPLPHVNVWLHGELVDAYWPEHALVVELDGGHHARPAQLRRDRARDLLLRRHGILVVRYDWDLVTRHPSETRADLVGQLGARRNAQPA